MVSAVEKGQSKGQGCVTQGVPEGLSEKVALKQGADRMSEACGYLGKRWLCDLLRVLGIWASVYPLWNGL